MISNFHYDIIKLISGIASEFFFRGTFKAQDPIKEDNRVVLSKNVANILVGNKDVRFILKIHYDDLLGRDLLKKFSNVQAENATSKKIDDLFLECCNLLAGRLKKIFEDVDVNIGISIPVKTRGVDEFFFDRKDLDEFSHELVWEMKGEESCFYMSVFIEVLNESVMEYINFEKINNQEDDEEEVEFF